MGAYFMERAVSTATDIRVFRYCACTLQVRWTVTSALFTLYSAWIGNVAVVNLLLEHGRVDLELTNRDGKTAKDLAREMEHTEILELFETQG
ncbi:hypothetical protein FA13DRAFT_1729996 [Coprinellus micaceus]|uniref:Ankyrin n=1 Tax=Coprinellus micaceus TaxID=71717 RepID=A0A4Y7THT2_COPMI|nr:hypothetical protein FA13DRAFT_1746484 [Coprinellus micaceus]TEB33726.1 hypothetical protein FA13DRAFT_1729996 [Coprinellus micaceus]